MKEKKTLIMSITIAILLIATIVLSILLITRSNNDEKIDTTTENTGVTKSEDVDDVSSENGDTATDKTTTGEDESRKSEEKTDKNKGTDFSVDINQENSWEDGENKCATVNIVINNNTKKTVKDWKLEITYNSDVKINNIWNGEKEISGSKVVITPADYNAEIASNSSVNPGYNISAKDLKVNDYILYIEGKEYTKEYIEAQKITADKQEKITEEKTEKTQALSDEDGTPFENHGKLSVKGTELVDKDGKSYQLKGCSTHGITWFPDYVNEASFSTLRDNWGVNVIRLAMYTDTGDSYGYCSGGDKEEIMALLDKGVSAATKLGMYVIIDWHILSDINPNNHIDDSKEFFSDVSKKYKDYDNVIYEICNEPNSGTNWQDVKSYAETIIPVIRENAKESIIIVGTPTWCQDVDEAAKEPVTGYDNIMYSLHFYASTHKQDIRDKAQSAIDAGLPLFISEFSICEASGNGSINYDEADKWFELIEENNLSYVSWGLCNKNESASLISSSCKELSDWSEEDLSESGKYIIGKISGKK